MKLNKIVLFMAFASLVFASGAAAQKKFVIKKLGEKKVAELPAGSLYWRIENFATLGEAKAASGPTGLAVGSRGMVWLFTLGSSGGSMPAKLL